MSRIARGGEAGLARRQATEGVSEGERQRIRAKAGLGLGWHGGRQRCNEEEDVL